MSMLFYRTTSAAVLLIAAAVANAGDDAVTDADFDRGIAAITVGPDVACDFPTISQAIGSQVDGGTVRVMTGTYDERVALSSRSLRVIGGFPDCVSTEPTGRSTIDRGGAGLGLDVFYPALVDGPFRLIEIENFVIQNAGGVAFDSGAAVVEGRPGRMTVNFRNVQFSDNARIGVDDDGGGLRIITTGDRAGTAPFVTVDNSSTFLRNRTAGDGGAIHCRSTHDQTGGDTLRIGSTLIFDNEAVNGGGLALDGCEGVFVHSGGPLLLLFPLGGVLNNTATGNGGGIHAINGARVEVLASATNGFGVDTEAALLAGNSAGSDGGAVYVSGALSRVVVSDAYVLNNTAGSRGGAFYVIDSAELEVRRPPDTGACDPITSGGGVLSRPPCSVIEGNEAGGGGAVGMNGTGSARIIRTFIRGNTAAGSDGAVARLFNSTLFAGAPAVLQIESSLIHDNEANTTFRLDNNSALVVDWSTVVEDDRLLRMNAVADRTARVDFRSSIVRTSAPVWSDLQGDGVTDFDLDCVLGNVPAPDTGGTAVNYTNADPLFRNEAADDFRLGDRSPALDYCDDFAAPSGPGLDGNPRGQSWTGPEPLPAAGAVPAEAHDLGAYEMVFEPRTADLHIEIANPDLFVDASQTAVEFVLAVTNNGPEVAYADVDVLDDVSGGAITNRQWTCAAPPGVTCTPASGNGQVQAAISDLPPGDIVILTVTADLVDNGTDGFFNYAAAVFESGFNTDPNLANNGDGIEVRFGVFSDGFESPVPF